MTKLVIFATILALATANPPARVPAGLSPQQCPNYPYCTIAQSPVQHWGNTGGIGDYSLGQSNNYGYGGTGSIYNQGVSASPATIPSGVSHYQCPNYPFCGPTPTEAINYRRYQSHSTATYPSTPAVYSGSPTASHGSQEHVGNGHGGYYSSLNEGGARYPAGISPASCPNYPYCY